MPQVLLNRPGFKNSGAIGSARFLPLAALSLVAAVVLSFLLSFLFEHGFYFLIVVPIIAAAALAAVINVAVGRGHCRNKLIAGSLGFIAGLIMYLGYFQFGMIQVFGPAVALRVDLLPKYISFRMQTDVIRDAHSPDDDRPVPASASRSMINWAVFIFELGFVVLFVTKSAIRKAGSPYCESCGKWLIRESTSFRSETANAIVDALKTDSIASLATIFFTAPHGGIPNATVAIDYCPSIKEKSSACSSYLSLKQVVTRPKAITFDPLDSSTGKLLLDRIQLRAEEIVALIPRFKAFESYSNPTAATLMRDIAKVADERPKEVAVCKPVDAANAGKILTGKTAFVNLIFALVPLALVFISIGIAFYGGQMAFPDHPPLGGVSPSEVVIGTIILVSGVSLFLGNMVMLFVNPHFLYARYQRRLVKREFAKRPGHLVNPENANAYFVHIVPRANWQTIKIEDATDVGFLMVDKERGEVSFEGDKEYYRIPAGAIISCDVESYVQGEGSHAATTIYIVVFQVNRASGIWEIPVMNKSLTGKWIRKKREKWALELQTSVNQLMYKTLPSGKSVV